MKISFTLHVAVFTRFLLLKRILINQKTNKDWTI